MKCWECGKEDAMTTYDRLQIKSYDDYPEDVRERIKLIDFDLLSDFDDCPSMRHFCEKCYTERNKELNRIRSEYVRLKKKLMLERAVKMFEKQDVNIYDYKDIIDDMAQYIEDNPEKFDSSHEMVAAIVLVDNCIKCKMQYKLDRYRLDFYIPDYKIVLEIDGDMHKNNLYRDNQRDIKVREILGPDWETVRIGTKYIEQNAKALVDAMIAIKKEKQKIRRQHNGFLPEWYSTRNKAKRTRLAKTGDDYLFDI